MIAKRKVEELDFNRCLEIQQPYLGPVKGYYTDWTPLDGRPGLFPDLEKLHGDRDKNDLKALEGRTWDAVVDTSANVPRWVKQAAAVLRRRAQAKLIL